MSEKERRKKEGEAGGGGDGRNKEDATSPWKNFETGLVGSTGPIRHAHPPGLRTLYASQTPLCGSGQYSIDPAEVYLSKASVGRGRSSASPSTKATPWRSEL